MKYKIIIYLVLIFPPILIFGQSPLLNNCDGVRSGTFYFYPINSQGKFAIIRKDSMQIEVDLSRHDTSYWRIIWLNNCEFNLKFIRKSHPISKDESEFYNSHMALVKVLDVTKKYYIFTAGFDSLNHRNIIDTMWFKRGCLDFTPKEFDYEAKRLVKLMPKWLSEIIFPIGFSVPKYFLAGQD